MGRCRTGWVAVRSWPVGLPLFIVSGLGAAAATQFGWLLVARLCQAAGGCVGLVLGRAIVHDTARDGSAAATIAALNTVLLMSPALASVVGVWIADALGWRSIPVLLAVLGAVTLAGAMWLLDETVARRATPARVLLAQYRGLLTDPLFVAVVGAGSLTTTTMFVVLTASPFIVTGTLGLPFTMTGYVYAVFVGGLIFGNICAGALVSRLGFDRLMFLAGVAGLLGALTILGFALAGGMTLPAFLLGGLGYTVMAGTLAPLTLTRAVSLAPALRGSASGIYGCSQFLVGALAVLLAGTAGDPALGAGIVLALCATVGVAVFGLIAGGALRQRTVDAPPDRR